MNHLVTILTAVWDRLIITAIVTGSLAILVFTSGWALPVGVTLFGITILLTLAIAAS